MLIQIIKVPRKDISLRGTFIICNTLVLIEDNTYTKGASVFSKSLIKECFNELKIEKEMYWHGEAKDRFSYDD